MASKIKKNSSVIVTTDSKDYYDYIISISHDQMLAFKEMKYEELDSSSLLYGISSYQRKAINRNDKVYKMEFIK